LSPAYDLNQSSLERSRAEHGIRSSHCVAAQQESICTTVCEKTVQKKPILAEGQNDLPGLDVWQWAGGNLNRIARPQRGQHALPVHLQAQEATPTQRVCS
jgi:hypothetical protein